MHSSNEISVLAHPYVDSTFLDGWIRGAVHSGMTHADSLGYCNFQPVPNPIEDVTQSSNLVDLLVSGCVPLSALMSWDQRFSSSLVTWGPTPPPGSG